jgi:hypothetical protein
MLVGTIFGFPSVFMINQLSATASLVTTIKTFIAGTASHHDMPAYVAGGCIALHVLGHGVYGIHSCIRFYILRCPLVLGQLVGTASRLRNDAYA